MGKQKKKDENRNIEKQELKSNNRSETKYNKIKERQYEQKGGNRKAVYGRNMKIQTDKMSK